MNSLEQKKIRLRRRKLRIKRKLQTSAERPRLCISRSNKHFRVQIIDDTKGVTLVAASTCDKAFPDMKNRGNSAAAKELGKLLAEKAKQSGITAVVFDRNGLLYHGKIKAFADAARESGLTF